MVYIPLMIIVCRGHIPNSVRLSFAYHKKDESGKNVMLGFYVGQFAFEGQNWYLMDI